MPAALVRRCDSRFDQSVDFPALRNQPYGVITLPRAAHRPGLAHLMVSFSPLLCVTPWTSWLLSAGIMNPAPAPGGTTQLSFVRKAAHRSVTLLAGRTQENAFAPPLPKKNPLIANVF